MKLYTDAAYNMIICMKEDNVDMKWFVFQALLKIWKTFVDQNGKPDSLIPTEVITCKELVLDSHGQILEQNRLPGENEVRNQNSLFFL